LFNQVILILWNIPMSVLSPIRGLRAFCVAAQCLSFKKAAAHLYLTPSAISHQVKQLEGQLGITLFERQTRSIALTQVGKQFYKSIWPIVSELEETVNEFSQKKENITLTISMPEFFASELFVPRLSEWSELNTEINLQLETVKSDQDATKPSDLCIILSNGVPPANVVHNLFPLRYVPACNQVIRDKWLQRGHEALQSVPLIVHQARPWAWHQWADRALIDNFDPSQIIQLDSMFSIARAAQKGMGIALIPMPISTSWFEDELLFRLFDDDLVTNDQYFLIQNEEIQHQHAILTFVDWVKKTYENYG
jgi:LysR family glycine cleavage system transcriptional activator